MPLPESELVDQLADLVNILGTGTCPHHNCDGCNYEHMEAVDHLIALRARVEGNACPQCGGTGYVDPAPDSEFGRDLCPACRGRGVPRDYEPVPEWWKEKFASDPT